MTIIYQPFSAPIMPQWEPLLDLCFGPERKKRTVFRFRQNASQLEAFSFMAIEGQKLVGSISFWPVILPAITISPQRLSHRQTSLSADSDFANLDVDNPISIPLLGPLAVHPDLQGQGIGHTLIKKGLAACDAAKVPAVLIVGKPDYYGGFGFVTDYVAKLNLGGDVAPLTLMGREYHPNFLCKFVGEVKCVSDIS